jgi:hypothetical protein
VVTGDLVDLARSYTTELPRFRKRLNQARLRASAIEEETKKLVALFPAPHTILNTKAGGAERIYRYESFALADIKTLAKKLDCTINPWCRGLQSD